MDVQWVHKNDDLIPTFFGDDSHCHTIGRAEDKIACGGIRSGSRRKKSRKLSAAITTSSKNISMLRAL